VRLCGCRLLLALLRSVGVGGDEVFEIQDGSRDGCGQSREAQWQGVMAGFETVSWLRLPTAGDVRDVLGHVPRACAYSHDLALSRDS
jgi:hypothetical protein